MTRLPEAGIGEEIQTGPGEGPGLWLRVRAFAGQRFSYALGDQVVFSLGNMVVAAVMSRYCTPEFGIYILTQRALDVIQQLCSVTLWAPLMYRLPSLEEDQQRGYLGSIVALQLVALVLAVALLQGVAWWSSTSARGMYYGVFAPLVFTSVGIVFREFTRRMYFAEIRMKEAFWTDVVTNGLQIAGAIWLWRTHRLHVPNMLWMLSGCAMLVSLWWVLREWRTFRIHFGQIGSDFQRNLRLGKWFFGSNMVFMISVQCNPWVLGALQGSASVGAYSICEQVTNIPRVALVSIQNIMAPMMARAYADGGKPAMAKMVRRLDTILWGGSAIFAVGVVVIGKWFAETVYKHFPVNGRMVLIVLAINLVAYACTMAQGYALSALERADLTFYAQALGLVAQLAVSLWLIHRFALPGAALAMLLGSVVVLAVRQMYYSREMSRA